MVRHLGDERRRSDGRQQPGRTRWPRRRNPGKRVRRRSTALTAGVGSPATPASGNKALVEPAKRVVMGAGQVFRMKPFRQRGQLAGGRIDLDVVLGIGM